MAFTQRISLAIIAGIIVGLVTQNFAIGIAVFAVLLVFSWIPIYKKYAEDNPQHYWFKRKLFGWGWTPVTWQGWLVIIIYVALVLAAALTIDDDSSQREVVFTFIIPVVLLTLLMIKIAYRKGEKPKWQWGKDIEKYK